MWPSCSPSGTGQASTRKTEPGKGQQQLVMGHSSAAERAREKQDQGVITPFSSPPRTTTKRSIEKKTEDTKEDRERPGSIESRICAIL